MESPLNEIKVLDMTRFLAGPFCTMILNDLGAEVIKIERPEVGDGARQFGPYVNDRSAYFNSLNYGKKSVALDLKDEDDVEKFKRLVEIADVLVENFRPGTMDRLGLGYQRLKEINPELIYSAISGFGQEGPFSDKPSYDMIVQAHGGIMSVTGEEGGKPVRVGVSIGDIMAGVYSTIGIMTALFQRTTTGEGQKLDISMLDCQAAIMENPIVRYMATGDVPGPVGSRHPSITPYQAFPTSDDWIVVAVANNKFWKNFCEVLGLEGLIDDNRFNTNPKRCENYEELNEILSEEIKKHKTDELLEKLEDNDVPCTPVNDVKDLTENPQLDFRNMLRDMAGDLMGDFMVTGNPIKMKAAEEPEEVEPAPDIGEHNEEIFQKYL